MSPEVKTVVLIGANKEGLSLLPFLVKDKKRRLAIIADPNRDAMLFKLNELGYRLAAHLGIKTTTDLDEIKEIRNLAVIINATQDSDTERFLEQPEFRDVEKLGPLSAKLIWGARISASNGDEVAGAGNHKTALLEALREIVDAVRLTIDRKELFSVILKLAIESTRADRGSIMPLSKEEGLLRVEMAKGMDEEVVRKIRVPVGEGISGKVASEGRPLLISGKARNDDFEHLRERGDVKSALCVPLRIDGDIIGVLNVNSSESTHAFTNDDLDFLTNLSGLAAEVIQRSNEYEKMRVDSAKFTFWQEAEFIMSSANPLEKRLNMICNKLVGIVSGLTCFIYIYDEDQNRLFLRATSIKETKNLGPLSLVSGEGIEGSGMESMKDVILVDRNPEEHQKRVYLSLPMIAQGRLVGTFNGQVVSAGGLSIYHEFFLKDIRNLIATTLSRQKHSEREALRSRKMFAVDETGLEMVTMSDPKRLMGIIATTPAAILGAELAILRLRRNDTRTYPIIATYGLEEKEVRDFVQPIEKEAVLELFRKKNTVRRTFSDEASPYIRALLARPLFRDDQIVGVLTLFNKIGEGSLYPYGFSKTDADIFSRFAVYAEKALANIMKNKKGPGPAVREKELLSAPLALFEKRVDEELNRATRSAKKLVVMTVRIEGIRHATLKVRTQFETRLLAFLKERIRNFDMLVWLDEETIGLLFLDTDQKVTRMIGSIARAISTEEAFCKALKAGKMNIRYGYSSFPDGGGSFSELFAGASQRARVQFS